MGPGTSSTVAAPRDPVAARQLDDPGATVAVEQHVDPKVDRRNETEAQVQALAPRLAFHPPCSLQHGQRLRGGVETHLQALGFEVRVARLDSNLCCGSAGTYSVLQPELAYALRDRKLINLGELEPEVIVSANVGCIQHLQTGTTTPVRHWIEVLDEALR
jgi:glycolate oxidase iron-sulfur subunit